MIRIASPISDEWGAAYRDQLHKSAEQIVRLAIDEELEFHLDFAHNCRYGVVEALGWEEGMPDR